MAVVKTILKKTAQEAAVKVAGTDGSATISLADDLLPASQALTVGGTPTVNIISAHWTGAVSSTITIVRNSVTVLSIPADQPTQLDFEGMGFVDTISNTSDIVVTITGTAQVYLVLRKVEGYSSKVELAWFGQYDDPNQVGS